MQPSRVKRQKVPLACDPCRTRKTKCDGQGPTCQACQKKAGTGLKCTWQSNSVLTSSQLTMDHVPRVEVRSSLMQQDTSPPHPRDLRSTSATGVGSRSHVASATGERHSYPNQPITYPSRLSGSPISTLAPHLHAPDHPERNSDGVRQRQDRAPEPQALSPSEPSVHAIIGATVEEDSREGFFGSSSAGTFMQNVKRMVQQKVDGLQQPASNEFLQNQPLPASGHNTIRQKSVDYVLPSRRRADALMFAYWKYVHVLYPYLDKMQVQKDYENLWKTDGSVLDERSFICLLNAIFALSSQIDESTAVEEREYQANVFYTRARSLLDIVETGSVRSVQSFLLLGQYFQSTNESHPCWVFVGLGIRIAQSLGLHLPETSERAANDGTRELLRKVWHGCVLMDRVVSMTLGRPCIIGPKAALAVPLPKPGDNEHLVSESSESSYQTGYIQETCSIEFYVLSLKLYDILHDVIYNFYSVNFQQNKPIDSDRYLGSLSEGQISVFEIERRLLRWEQNIPDHLRMTTKHPKSAAEAMVYRQAVVLHQRQLHVRLLLLRPVLSNFITSEFHDCGRPAPLGTLLSHRTFLQCAIVCVKVACEAINTIYRERGSNASENGFVAAWWYNVLYLYTSATILIAARLSSAILADVSEESILLGWHKAIEVLEEYNKFGTSIQRLTTTLRFLFEAVPQQYSRLRQFTRRAQADSLDMPLNHGQGASPLLYPRPLISNNFVSTPVDDRPDAGFQDDHESLPNDSFLDFATGFDPNDLSWLMTIPQDS